jgi:hypothetical protein
MHPYNILGFVLKGANEHGGMNPPGHRSARNCITFFV